MKEIKSTTGAWFIQVKCSKFRPYKVCTQFSIHKERVVKKSEFLKINVEMCILSQILLTAHMRTVTNDLLMTPFKIMLFIELITVLI